MDVAINDEFENSTTDPTADHTQAKTLDALKVAWTKGKKAAWENRWPGFWLWIFGVALIAGYYLVPQFRIVLESLGELKSRFGLLFSIFSTAIFGGLLPVVFPVLIGKSPSKHGVWALLISNVAFWALKGIEIDLFYQFQAWMFGDNNDFRTIVTKVFVDQAFYAPFIGLFNCVLFYVWRDNGYSFGKTKQSLGKNWYMRRVVPALISNWCVWLPSVILIYQLPLGLQLPVQNLILCFWVLVWFSLPMRIRIMM